MKIPKDSRFKKRFHALEKLLSEDTTSLGRVEAVRKLIKGLDPRVDAELKKAVGILKKINKMQKGKVISLVLPKIPAKTQKDKRRKKLLLLLVIRWKKLKKEVKRVKREMKRLQSAQTMAEKATAGSKIAAFAKGPFGILTLVAGVIVAGVLVLESKAVRVEIVNQGCRELVPTAPKINLPGIKLPDASIPDGGSGVIVVPPFRVTIDGTSGRSVVLTAVGFSFTFNLAGEDVKVSFNGSPLLGRRSEINLGSQKRHVVVVQCPERAPTSGFRSR